MFKFIIALIAMLHLTHCGTVPPNQQAAATDSLTPVPTAVPVPAVQTTPVAAITPEAPKPDSKLWQDPLSGTYWLVAGLGSVDKALNLCYGNYRPPSYFDLYRASIDGLAKLDPRITQIWSLDSAYFDPTSSQNEVYYVDLLTSTMNPASPDDVKGLACIWEPKSTP